MDVEAARKIAEAAKARPLSHPGDADIALAARLMHGRLRLRENQLTALLSRAKRIVAGEDVLDLAEIVAQIEAKPPEPEG